MYHSCMTLLTIFICTLCCFFVLLFAGIRNKIYQSINQSISTCSKKKLHTISICLGVYDYGLMHFKGNFLCLGANLHDYYNYLVI